MAINENQLIFDYDLLGRIDANGGIHQVWEGDALSNSIKMWIASYRGEIIREPNRGGYLLQWLTKPMNPAFEDHVSMAIRNGFEQDFKPYLQIQYLTVTANMEKRRWDIYMEVFAPSLNLKTTVDAKIQNTVSS